MNILITGIDHNRIDLVDYIKSGEVRMLFLENFVKTGNEPPGGQVLSWDEYPDAFDLLEKVKPAKVIFALIDNYYHFALFVAARELGIPLVFMDHGIRFEEEYELIPKLELIRPGRLQERIKNNHLRALYAYWKNTFYRRTIARCGRQNKSLLRKLLIARATNTYGIFWKNYGHYFKPDTIIAYSDCTYGLHKKNFRIEENDGVRVVFTGVPSLDKYDSGLLSGAKKSEDVLFIDQPLHEAKMLGWTRKNKIQFFEEFAGAVAACNKRLFIKPHPWNENIYEDIAGHCSNVVVSNNLESMINEVRFIGSFHSTLLLGFCANENFVSFCMDMHPSAVSPSFSSSIIKYKVAKSISSFEELKNLLSGKHDFIVDEAYRQGFIRSVLFALDGNAGVRLMKALAE